MPRVFAVENRAMAMTWKEWLAGGAALGGMLVFLRAFAALGPCDSAARFTVVGDDVLIQETNFGGRRDLGGSRVVRIDGASGRLEQWVSVDGWELLGAYGDRVWFAHLVVAPSWFTGSPRAVLARRADDLGVVATTSDLIAAHPELAAIGNQQARGCFDRPSGAYRFTDVDGTYRALDLTTESVGVVDSIACVSELPVTVDSLRWTDDTVIRAAPEQGAARFHVVDPEGVPLDIGGTQLKFLALPPLDGAVWVVRRVDTDPNRDSELIRFNPVDGSVRWTAVLPGIRGVSLERVMVAGDRLFLADHLRTVAVDVRTGAVLWQRGPWSVGLW